MSESGPVPGGRPGEVEPTPALSGEQSGRDLHGVVPAYATGMLGHPAADPAGAGRPVCRRLPGGPRDEAPDDG
ncbi:hypothetical protein [Streptomyces mutabilis]|uniref:Uncharacterized protein n=1 Tax=Streptomyces mutabilis TaxID=67332 RepID=A0A086MUD3_9ACTN|nr:hypothetical protein [Streptomyces mutabilis]KFG72501.1 hypothetical protein FM21_16450 [Streptomyces mutabilis]